MKLRHLVAFLSLATLPAAIGCSVETTEDPDEFGADEAELTAAGKALIGSYEASGDLRALVLETTKASNSRNHFFAIVDTHIVCIKAPCPSEVRIEGTWWATKSQLKLRPDATKGSVEGSAADKLKGNYKYDLIPLPGVPAGEPTAKLHLEPVWHATIALSGSLAKVNDYCDTDATATEDCRAQDVAEAMCGVAPVGLPRPHFTCTIDHRCHFSCNVRPSCPQLTSPPPNFCPNGEIVPRHSTNGCTAGFDCVPFTCPAKTSINCMPPTTNPACSGNFHKWIGANCPNVMFLH